MSSANGSQEEKPVYTIYTDRLILRLADPRIEEDCQRILQVYLDAKNGQETFGMTGVDDVRYKHELHGLRAELCTLAPPPRGMIFLVLLLQTGNVEGDFVGVVSFCCRPEMPYPDLGWATLQAYRGRGFASEAAKAALEFWTETIGVKEICAMIMDSNEGSVRLAERIGFVKAGTVEVFFGVPPSEEKVLGRGFVLPGMKWRDGLWIRAATVRPQGWRWKG